MRRSTSTRWTSRSSTTEQPKTAVLERVWLDDPRPRAGRTRSAENAAAHLSRARIVRTVPIEIPPNASGTLSVWCPTATGWGWPSNARRESQPRSVDQMIKALNKARRNNTLYVKLVELGGRRSRQRRALSSLPPSVLGVLEGDRNGGNFNPLHSATLGEWELATDHAVTGSRTLTITVSQN